jgi:hypothetical protein
MGPIKQSPTKLILDMVHHNPGEPPFHSAFLDPAHLQEYGYTGQVFKHLNCAATFDRLGLNLFPAGSAEGNWLKSFTSAIRVQIAAAKGFGLQVFFHLDLFVLPRKLVEHFRSEICDPSTGRILLDRPRTLEIHRVLFEELAERFPEVDGYIIRVGETYLFDTPFHVGNGPIPTVGPSWTPTYLYEETLSGRAPDDARWTEQQADAYVKIIGFLSKEICDRHKRLLIFRTWDIFPDKLHARLDHYLEVTDRIKPNPRLIFSIKHTALDFWRRVAVNECLGKGRHPQIVEVQCQREYEGKGAYPNYVMDGVINGFEENSRRKGLKELLQSPLIRGAYSWSRGGGWYGPYIKDELWPDLNAYVLAKFCSNPALDEAAIFDEYAREILKLDAEDATRLRELALLSSRAILLGRYCEPFDKALREKVLPAANWMRDDRLGGIRQLATVLDYLVQHDLTASALREKAEAVQLWNRICKLASDIHWPDESRGEFVRTSAEYGHLLFSIVYQGWRVLVAGRRSELGRGLDLQEIRDAISQYDSLWKSYRELSHSPMCSSLYRGCYFNLPGMPEEPGLQESVDRYRSLLHRTGEQTSAAGEEA